MIRILNISRQCIAACWLALAMFACSAGANAASYKVLYTFTGGSDGLGPISPLIADSAGNLYGVTSTGPLFKLAPNGALTVLDNFEGGHVGIEGDLVRDKSGNLYGTTYLGGLAHSGTLIKRTPDGMVSLLYTFCTKPNCIDGVWPTPEVSMDAGGNIYGITLLGGRFGRECRGGCGIVFRISPKGREKTLHVFCTESHCADGADPGYDGGFNNGVIVDTNGNLYGTTQSGGIRKNCPPQIQHGPPGCGTLFKLSPDGTETVIYSFKGGTDGANPIGTLAMDEAGNLYGATLLGGQSNQNPYACCGIAFKVAKDGTETVLHAFGAYHWDGVIVDRNGNLYGTTVDGGTAGNGQVFKIGPDRTFTVLYDFSDIGGGTAPGTALLLRNGRLYGTAVQGGNFNGICAQFGCGTVFELTP